MKRKVTVLVLVGLTLLLVLAVFGSQALARGNRGGSAVPFEATYTTYPEFAGAGDGYILLDIPGEGEGTHVGKSTWFADGMRVDLVDPPQPQVSIMVITASNGDELFGHYFGFGWPKSAGGNYYWGGYDITGGTGRFEGAYGSGLYHGTCGEVAGTVTFEGNLFYP